jgi:glycoprotease/Kae1 family metallohydrolase
MVLCLGIESTAHTFSASVMKDSTILSNCIKPFTTVSGGMIPSKVAQHHVDCCSSVISQALCIAGCSITDIQLVAFSRAPGIGHMLKVASVCASSLHELYGIPLIGVNHSIAHLEIGRFLSKTTDPILLYVSGANTQVIAYMNGRYRIFGETLDTGIGNFLDTFAREAKLGFPGGPKIAELATQSKTYIELPYVVKGMDVTFSGLLTNVTQKLHSGKYSLPDLCYSIQETVFASVVEIAERALAHCQKTELVLGGGVACNTRLQEMCHQMCRARGAVCYIPDNQYNVDNAAMIAHLGILMYTAGERTTLATIDPYQRVDQVQVTWR